MTTHPLSTIPEAAPGESFCLPITDPLAEIMLDRMPEPQLDAALTEIELDRFPHWSDDPAMWATG